MHQLRIMVVCGFGLGTSMILKLKLDSVLRASGLQATTFCADMTTGPGSAYDLVVTSHDLLPRFQQDHRPAIAIRNFLSEAEISEKGLPVIRQLLQVER